MSFIWYQKTGGEDAWIQGLADHRQKIIAEVHPAFVTILSAHSAPDSSWGRDEYAKMKYSGPLYFDWDAEKVEDTIPEFQKFLVKLQEDQGVNLKQVRLYATGGRGFHCEIPEDIFMTKVPRTGTQALPYIYRDMALELAVPTLDLRVYTGRKGRMWRTPNVKRSNDKYKVPITLEEALSMTSELYEQVCAEPRAEFEREAPTTATGLSALFAQSQAKINESVKRQVKSGVDTALLAKFKGEFPDTMRRIMAGEDIAPGVGFQKISMQLAIAANALGKTGDELVAECEGLCKNHTSDSSRYNSPRKRKEELLRMYDYTHDNPCYSFSAGGLRSLLEAGANSGDLDVVDRAIEGSVPESADAKFTDDQEAEIDLATRQQSAGLIVHPKGIFLRAGEGLKPLSHVSFIKPTRLIDTEEKLHIGFEVEVLADGKVVNKSAYLPLETFKSRAKMHDTMADYGGTFMGDDKQAGALLPILDTAARKSGREVFTVHREGLDIVQNPFVEDRIQKDVIWATPDQVLTHVEGTSYRFRTRLAKETVWKSDVHTCPPMQDTPDTRAFLHNAFRFNDPLVVASVVGWFVSCLHKQFYNASFNQFPLLHPNGQAGSGKTQGIRLWGKLWHWKNEPAIFGCTVLSKFARKSSFQGSASIPMIFDEYKPHEMGPILTSEFQDAFRLAYNQAKGMTAGINRGGATSSFRDLTSFDYSSPIVYMAEAQEQMTAVAQRSLAVGFTGDARARHTDEFRAAENQVQILPSLGSALLRAGMLETVESRKEALNAHYNRLRPLFHAKIVDRQVYNLAIVHCGLDFLDKVLAMIFGDAMRGEIDRLRESVYTQSEEITTQVVNEASKVLNDMALISRTELPDSEFAVREGYEYLIGEGYIEILMRETFVKYFSWNKRKGFNSLYVSADAFIAAMSKYDAVIDKVCISSPLRQSGSQRVYRFSLQKLAAEGVDEFRMKAGA